METKEWPEGWQITKCDVEALQKELKSWKDRCLDAERQNRAGQIKIYQLEKELRLQSQALQLKTGSCESLEKHYQNEKSDRVGLERQLFNLEEENEQLQAKITQLEARYYKLKAKRLKKQRDKAFDVLDEYKYALEQTIKGYIGEFLVMKDSQGESN